MSQDFLQSSYREKLIEHLLIGELLKISWLHHSCSLEVARPEVDNSGYDIILESGKIVRHVQIKASSRGSVTASQKIQTKLKTKPSACVVWVYFDEKTMELGPFYFFGANAGLAIPSLEEFNIAKHTKANKDGVKSQRPGLCIIPKSRFCKIDTTGALYARLFELDAA
jgi:hypothetical protein